MEYLKERHLEEVHQSSFARILLKKAFRTTPTIQVSQRALRLFHCLPFKNIKQRFVELSPEISLRKKIRITNYLFNDQASVKEVKNQNHVNIWEDAARAQIHNDLQFSHNYLNWYSQWDNISRDEAESMAIILGFARSLRWCNWHDKDSTYFKIFKELPLKKLLLSMAHAFANSSNFRTRLRIMNIDDQFKHDYSWNKDLGKMRTLSEAQKLIISYISACNRDKNTLRDYRVDEEILNNVIDDNAHIHEDKLFYVSERTISNYIFDSAPKKSLEMIRKRLIKGHDIHLFGKSLEQICISTVQLVFYDSAKSIKVSEEELIVFYDQTTKYLFGAGFDRPNFNFLKNIFEQIAVNCNNGIPKKILLDPILLNRFRFAFDPLRDAGVNIQVCKTVNKKLNRFLRFFTNKICLDITNFYFQLTEETSKFNVFLDIKSQEGKFEYDDVIASIPNLLEYEFNSSKEYKKRALITPNECFLELKKAELLPLTTLQFAQIFYDKLECIVSKNSGFFLIDQKAYYFRFTQKISCEEAICKILIDVKNPSIVFVKINGKFREAKVIQAFSSNDDLAQLLFDGPASEIINVKSEVTKNLKEWLNISEQSKSLFKTLRTSVLRKQMLSIYE